jgi:capsular exopolysaccharide synthesis family protein
LTPKPQAATPPSVFESFADESPAGTEFRRLHVRLSRDGGSRLQTIQITSSRRGEGKSTVAAHLALTIARHTQGRVGLVDCDLRKPRIHELYGLEQGKGMTDFMRGILPLKTVMKETRQPNLRVITSGRVISGPSKLFETEVIQRAFSKIVEEFDIVLVDSPPLLPVSDPLLLASEMDGVLMVVMAGRTPRQVVRRARGLLTTVEANVLGVVVNNASEALPYYYDYKYYGYDEEVPRMKARGVSRSKVRLVAPQGQDRK